MWDAPGPDEEEMTPEDLKAVALTGLAVVVFFVAVIGGLIWWGLA